MEREHDWPIGPEVKFDPKSDPPEDLRTEIAEGFVDARRGQQAFDYPTEQPTAQRPSGGVWVTLSELADLMTPVSSTLPWTEENQRVVKERAAAINDKWIRGFTAETGFLPPYHTFEQKEDTMADKTDTQVREIHAALLEEYDQLIDFINGDPIDGSPKKGKIVAGIIHRRNEVARTIAIMDHGEPTAQQPSENEESLADHLARQLGARSALMAGFEYHPSEDQTPAEAPESAVSGMVYRHLAASYILRGLLDLSLELLRD